MKYHFNTSLHQVLRIIFLYLIIMGVGCLTYSIITGDTNASIFCAFFVVWCSVLYRTVFRTVGSVSFDDEFLYSSLHAAPLPLKAIISRKKGLLIFSTEIGPVKVKLPNFYFLDENYGKFKAVLKRND